MRCIVYTLSTPPARSGWTPEVTLPGDLREYIDLIWPTIGAVWIATGLRPQQSPRAGNTRARLVKMGAAAFLFSQWPQGGLLNTPWHAATAGFGAPGLVHAAGGAAFAICAHIHLGKNCEGAARINADHEIVRRGPCPLVRHPIHTRAQHCTPVRRGAQPAGAAGPVREILGQGAVRGGAPVRRACRGPAAPIAARCAAPSSRACSELAARKRGSDLDDLPRWNGHVRTSRCHRYT
jgi:hypothetical protein